VDTPVLRHRFTLRCRARGPFACALSDESHNASHGLGHIDRRTDVADTPSSVTAPCDHAAFRGSSGQVEHVVVMGSPVCGTKQALSAAAASTSSASVPAISLACRPDDNAKNLLLHISKYLMRGRPLCNHRDVSHRGAAPRSVCRSEIFFAHRCSMLIRLD